MTIDELVAGIIGGMNRIADALEKSAQPELPAPVPEPVKRRTRSEEKPEAKPNGEVKPGAPTHDDAMKYARQMAERFDRAVVANLVRQFTGAGTRVADLPPDKIEPFIVSAQVMLAKKDDDGGL
jgi:hypothetical protein